MNEDGAQLRDDTVLSLRLSAGLPPSETEQKHDFFVKSGVAISVNSIEGVTKTGGQGEEREKRLYVFDRDHLDGDPEEIAKALAVLEEQVLTEPPLTRQSYTISFFLVDFDRNTGKPTSFQLTQFPFVLNFQLKILSTPTSDYRSITSSHFTLSSPP